MRMPTGTARALHPIVIRAVNLDIFSPMEWSGQSPFTARAGWIRFQMRSIRPRQ